jgi:hypothetical protein
MLVAAKRAMASRHDRYAIAAVALLGIAVVIETFRLVAPGHTWPGFAPMLSRAASAGLIALWTATAVSLVFRRRHRVFASLAWTLAYTTPLFMVAHAAITRVGGSFLGLLYVPVAVAVGFALKGTLDRGERKVLPTKDPGGRPPGAEKAYRLMARPKH